MPRETSLTARSRRGGTAGAAQAPTLNVSDTDVEVVKAAMSTVIETIQIEYG
ncbi:MAG: hypothetical protein H0V17_32370 [Deltaproteobacteria bacterium]|nr:hypothetical protein [Deltaproteobacteria bacterium]